MKRVTFTLFALLIGAAAFSQVMLPPRTPAARVPPMPRDGEGDTGAIVPILIYHSIRPYIPTDTKGARRWIATPETLESELSYLRENGYSSVTFDVLEAHISKGAPLPARPVIISFDDDWQSQYVNAVPLLRKYGFTATFFVWVRAVGRAHHMTWDEIRELDAEGMEIGCHTLTHLILPKLKSDDMLRREIVASKDLIEAHIGHPVTSLAYPFGQYDERVVGIARDAGFTSARSTWPGVFHTKDGLLSLTGLIRTETTASLVDTLSQHLAQAERLDREGSGLPEPR
ncbi:MAG: polysaccharide deacetylase family protein [Spirochaetia bacterium]